MVMESRCAAKPHGCASAGALSIMTNWETWDPLASCRPGALDANDCVANGTVVSCTDSKRNCTADEGKHEQIASG